jgi:hypothetical protein
MKIEEITKGFVFYDGGLSNFTWYEYLMPMPVKNPANEGEYHIVIDKKLERPERMYKHQLQTILDKNLFTFEDLRKYQIKEVENFLDYLKKEN